MIKQTLNDWLANLKIFIKLEHTFYNGVVLEKLAMNANNDVHLTYMLVANTG